MKKLLVLTVCLTNLCFYGTVFAEDGGMFAKENFSGTLTLTSDYVFRGISYSSENFAVQGSVDYAYGNFYSGIWTSNTTTSDPDSGVEFDAYAGYWGNLGFIDYDLTAWYFMYPGADDDGYEYNYTEYSLGLSHTFTSKMSTTVGVKYAFAPDTFGEDGVQNTVSTNIKVDLPAGFGLDLVVGHSDVEGDKYSGNGWGEGGGSGYDWTWYKAGINYGIKGYNLALDYWDTSDIEENYLGSEADSRVVFSISRSL